MSFFNNSINFFAVKLGIVSFLIKYPSCLLGILLEIFISNNVLFNLSLMNSFVTKPIPKSDSINLVNKL